MDTMLRVLIADDHPLFREALRHVVSLVEPDAHCVEAASIEQALALLGGEEAFDLLLLDLGLPGVSGLSGVVGVRAQAAATPVVIVSAWEDPEVIRQAVRLGVSGFLPKSADKQAMAAGLAKVLRGETCFSMFGEAPVTGNLAELESLTPRQLMVLRLLGEGKSNKQIAFELSISQETVKIHISAILRKLGVTSRSQAILVANRILHSGSTGVPA
jgi:DNA-binding NarL/FixJ family response regulator